MPMLVLVVLALATAGVAGSVLLRGRIRQRMAGIDRRLDGLQQQVEALRVPAELSEIERLLVEGEAGGKISAQTASELRQYVSEIRADHDRTT